MQIVDVPLSLSGYGVGLNMSPMASSPVTLRGHISPVRRRLSFSDSDGETPMVDNRRAMERQLAQLQKEQSQKWNFDFVQERALAGRYVWQQTTLLDRPSHPLPPPAGIKRPIDNQQGSIVPPLCKQFKSDNINDSVNNNHRTVVISQRKITDFMKNQKLNGESMTKRRDNGPLPSNAAGLNGH